MQSLQFYLLQVLAMNLVLSISFRVPNHTIMINAVCLDLSTLV